MYCDFYSLPTETGPVSQRLKTPTTISQSKFLDALECELSLLPIEFRPTTLFLGGGTPTELSLNDFTRLMNMIHRHVDLSDLKEWTCEANPGTLQPPLVHAMRNAGINRVSLGVQSFQDHTLEQLGRIHSGEEAIRGYHILREYGFKNINIDLIFGTPGTSHGDLEEDLSNLLSLRPEHAAVYCLMFEPGTPLTELKEKGYIRKMDDLEESARYHFIRKTIIPAGYLHYEISNFAHAGYACQHNLLYWSGGEYIGCGPAASSHWNGNRFSNVRDLTSYCDALLSGKSTRSAPEYLPPADKAREVLVMSLRQLGGVDETHFRRTTGFNIDSVGGKGLDQMLQLGMLEWREKRLQLTEEALFVSDAVFAELV